MSTLIPIMSEKSYKLSQTRNTFVFSVPMTINKAEVAKALKEQYSVESESITILVSKGKAVRFIRKGGRVNTGIRQSTKKAYVRLKAGQSLPIFDAVDEALEKESNAEQKVIEQTQQKRGLFGKKKDVAKSSGVSAQVTRTQAKVGEK